MDRQRSMAVGRGASPSGAAATRQTDYEAAFVEAYERYYTRVFAYVYSRVGNVEVSKDLTAEVFEKAYVKGHSLRESAAYSTWLFMIAKNAVIGHYRRHKRESSGINKIKESLWLAEHASDDPEVGALQGEAVSNLMRHLKQLSQRDQELLSLKFEGGLSYAEISSVLRLSEVNVRVSIFRALKRLRNLIEEKVP